MPFRYPAEFRRKVLDLSISRSLETELAVTRRANELLKAQVMSPKEGSRRWG